MKADSLRDSFLDFFRSRKHKIVESDSLVPKDDPTVLFTPAGMNQFKKQFLGFTTGFSRAATSQRCLRTDDLDKVGKTSGHHTFFEMLGNFSFGDYFKEEAITWAWEFLTGKLKIEEDKLWVSVYKDDDEAYQIWSKKIKVPLYKIIRLGDKDNFWPAEAKEKGPNGPCGPCSEIFFDRGKDKGCGKSDCTPACDCGRFIEVWNLVFTQFNRKEGGALEPLPKKNIDTGMGLERMVAVMQGVENNFETDLFGPIIEEILQNTHYTLHNTQKELIYAIADHIRAIVFAIYDGVLPSNEARGYVARKIIRKSVLHLRSLGIKKAFLYKLVPVLSDIMKAPYPDLSKRRENISEIILAEEKNFISTLNASDTLLEEKFAPLLKNPDPEEAGRIAFQLYDTYGLPIEITREWLDKHKIGFSEEVFNTELKAQRTRSKAQSAMKGDVFSVKDLHLELKATRFLGYEDYVTRAKIVKIIKDGQEVKKINKDDEAKIILDKTVFYAESGGQVGDSGSLLKGKNIFAVSDTKKSDKVAVHSGKLQEGILKSGDMVTAKVNIERRLAIARNHSATHLLQAALRNILGSHVQQQGSLVAEERLRFDFTHFKDVSKEELDHIEATVNNYILDNQALCVKTFTLSEAKKSGALAFFGEKYEGRVRVVSISDVSKEFCGGTHLDSTGSIGLFKIIQEMSVASGVRRIEAVTGKTAYKMFKDQVDLLEEAASFLSTPKDRIITELQKRTARIKDLEKELTSYKASGLKAAVESKEGELVGQTNFVVYLAKDKNEVREAVDLIKERSKNNTIIFSSTGTNLDSQISLALGVTPDLCEKGVDAGKLIKEIAADLGGSGGGRKDFAQAGGNNPANYLWALEKLKEIIRKI